MKTEKELLSENPSVPSSSIEVQSVLTKYHYVRGGDFQFKIFPITKSFILSELNQIKKVRGLSLEEEKLFLTTKQNQYLNNTSCAFFEMSSLNVLSEESLQNWEISIGSALGGIYPIVFNSAAVKTFSNLYSGLSGIKEKWTSYGIGCSRVKVPVENGFSIILRRINFDGSKSKKTKIVWGR